MGAYEHWAKFVGLNPEGTLSAAESAQALEEFYSLSQTSARAVSGFRKFAPVAKEGFPGLLLRGFASAYLPTEPLPAEALGRGGPGAIERIAAWGRGGEGARPSSDFIGPMAPKGGIRGAIGEAAGAIPKSVTKMGGKLASGAFKVFGPIYTGYRLSTETEGKGLLGGTEKAVRILGEEGITTAAAVGGMALGSAITGATIGSPGGIPGMVVGAAIGLVAGVVGSWAWNKAVDVATFPAKAAKTGWDAMAALGRRSTKLELGGGVSVGNRTRGAQTMRQRHLMAMNRSGMNERSLLGREANLMHVRSLT